jgi:hypothetical protein
VLGIVCYLSEIARQLLPELGILLPEPRHFLSNRIFPTTEPHGRRAHAGLETAEPWLIGGERCDGRTGFATHGCLRSQIHQFALHGVNARIVRHNRLIQVQGLGDIAEAFEGER